MALIICSCKRTDNLRYKAFYNSENKKIGDSVFLNKMLTKVIFIDKAYFIDSIVYKRYNNDSLKSVNTFRKGKIVFENKEYYENGKVKDYFFIDEDNPKASFQASYNQSGICNRVVGAAFFQIYYTGVNKDATVKLNTQVRLNAFFPNPPNAIIKVFIRNEDGSIYDNIFSQNKHIIFLKQTSWDNTDLGYYKIDVCLDITINCSDKSLQFHDPLTFQVVN